MENVIALNGIKQDFDNKCVLEDINLSVAKNEIFGLLGPSGAGKTTMIKIITGQLKPTCGESKVFGTISEKLSPLELTKLGIVMENCGLYNRLSCYDNLKVFAKIYNVKFSDIDKILGKVGLSDARNKAVNKLSKGMRQRLIIARALLHNPTLVFLDEPTSGLDPSSAQEIHKLLLEIREQGVTIFLTTHNMVEATKLCDNVALLNDGKIVEYGKPSDICTRHIHNVDIVYKLRNGYVGHSSENMELFISELKSGSVISAHSDEPSLEDVFLKLAGRRFE